MECTQRLEFTQELYDTQSYKVCPEQIGFLGICGSKHPVIKGPNKIGRDPQTCNIVLNLNSISRQHAVINILNRKEFMLMDLDSANKTKLQNKTLQPYMPQPLKNGDMVQFGDIFGVFRLLDEEDELPMTQAIDIPETPAPSRLVAKVKAPITLIPESPDVSMSDKDESFHTPSKSKLQDSQTKNEKHHLSNSQFIPSFGKSIPIQAISSPRMDSKQSSRSSTSIGLKDNTSSNESLLSKCNKYDDIHEMDTQPPNPIANDSSDSIYSANTQIPEEQIATPAIHGLDTQLPVSALDHLPQVQKIHDRHEMHFDLYAANKENDVSIFNAETQPFVYDKNESTECKTETGDTKLSNYPPEDKSKEKHAPPDEELLFDDIDDGHFEEDFHSQALLPPELPFTEVPNGQAKTFNSTHSKEDRSNSAENTDTTLSKPSGSKPIQTSNVKSIKRDTRIKSDESTDCEDFDIAPIQCTNNMEHTDAKPLKRVARIQSDSSTDCEESDIVLSQKVTDLPFKKRMKKEFSSNVKKSAKKPLRRINRIKSDSSTDCEDMIPTQIITEIKIDGDDLTDCEDLLNTDLNELDKPNKSIQNFNNEFAEMDTQKIEPINTTDQALEDMPTQIIKVIENDTDIKNEDDVATQILEEVPTKSEDIKKSFQDIVSPFKIPLQSLIKSKSKDIAKNVSKNKIANCKQNINDSKYYEATQDIYKDLCSQRSQSPEINAKAKKSRRDVDEVVPCSVEDYKVEDRFANIEKVLSPKKLVRGDKSSSSEGDENVKKYVGSLSSQEVRDVIGVKTTVAKLNRCPSDASDGCNTPKKVRPFKLMNFDLPNSQEIKTSVTRNFNVSVTESSSESEPENSEEQYTPLLYTKKKPAKVTKVIDFEKLPDRVITRVRKPTAKVQDGEIAKNILKPKFFTEQEDQIDKDIIIENITRLKNTEKGKGKCEKKDEKVVKKERKSENKIDPKTKPLRTKIKVKIEKPKKKETKSKSDGSTRKSDESKKKVIPKKSDSTLDLEVGSRTTRSKKKQSDTQPIENKSVSPDNAKSKTAENKRTRTACKKPEISISPEVEIRRSKRQQSAKERRDDSSQGEEESKVPKSILKKNSHEQSTVYNISSSSTESTKGLKRSAVNDSEAPSPKRTRALCHNTSGVLLRATPARTLRTQHVLFTAFPSEEVKQKLEKLGAVVVTDVMECSVVLTMQIRRTFKLLCAVGLGRPIVGPSWVQACVDTHMIVDPWLYLIKDETAEKRFNFSLEKTLTGKKGYLKGYNVSSTPSVQPNASEMKLIVECSGGSWHEGGPRWLCVSSGADRALWPALRRRGATLVTAEMVLGGVLRQRLDLPANRIRDLP